MNLLPEWWLVEVTPENRHTSEMHLVFKHLKIQIEDHWVIPDRCVIGTSPYGGWGHSNSFFEWRNITHTHAKSQLFTLEEFLSMTGQTPEPPKPRISGLAKFIDKIESSK